jgi:hypothetical protein
MANSILKNFKGTASLLNLDIIINQFYEALSQHPAAPHPFNQMIQPEQAT